MKLSVLMITYNQEKFIAQALDSILAQVVNFSYEVVIGEDCSTDSTRRILLEYQARYPDRIRLLLPDQNIGMMANFTSTFSACTGQYIAILEGDDYWTSPMKLQKQVDFLDQNPGCAICFNPTLVFFEDNGASSYVFPSDTKEVYSIEELLNDNFMHTCSVMCRNRLFSGFPSWFKDSVVGDYPLHLLNAGAGYIGCINEVMSAYRVHDAGVWSMQFDKHFVRNVSARIMLYENVDDYYGGKYHNIINDRIFLMEFMLYKRFQKDGCYFQSAAQLLKLVTKYPLNLFRRKFGKA